MSARHAWDPIANILGILFRPMHAPDLSKFTGLRIEVVNDTLAKMELDGQVRRNGRAEGWNGESWELWERVVKP